jgi:hypothetical protein
MMGQEDDLFNDLFRNNKEDRVFNSTGMRLPGLLPVFPFHLILDDPFLEIPSGQRIDQKDLGLLIKNIRHSLTEQRRGPVSISEDKDTIQIQVRAKMTASQYDSRVYSFSKHSLDKNVGLC